MDCDDFAEKFSEALFNYLWYIEGAVSDNTIAETITAVGNAGGDVIGFTDVLEFVKETTKTVFALSTFTFPSFNKSVLDYFKKNAINRLNVYIFLNSYRLHNQAPTDDIFALVLDTCSLIYRLFVFCRRMGHDEFVEFSVLSWTKIFDEDLDDDFYASGGWDEFRQYVTENRYPLKDVDTDKTEVAVFLESYYYISSKMDLERLNQQSKSSDHDSDKTTDIREELSGEEPQTTSQAAAYSFGAIASNIPGFNEKIKANVFQIVKTNSKIAKLLKEYKEKSVQSSLPPASESSLPPASESSLPPASESSLNPVVDTTTVEELSQACLSIHIIEGDHSSIDSNSTSEEVTTVGTITEIQEDSNTTSV